MLIKFTIVEKDDHFLQKYLTKGRYARNIKIPAML